MITINANSRKDFLVKYMKLHSLRESFTERELQVAVEFLYFREKYLEDPIYNISIVEKEDGEQEEIKTSMDMLHQLIDTRTISIIMDRLNMPMTVFRKHAASLKSRGFFGKDDIGSKFKPPKVNTLTIKLVVK